VRRRVQADEAGRRHGMGEEEADRWHNVGSKRGRLTGVAVGEGDWPASRPGKEDRRLSSPVPARSTPCGSSRSSAS
jgi:hypothetical protein